MMEIIPAIKKGLKTTPAYSLISYYRGTKQIADWRRAGCPNPPPHFIKQKTVSEYAKLFGINTLIETGTFMGEMISATRKVFKHIYSIELSQELFEGAKERFKKYHHIKIIHGDSGEVLPGLLRTVNSPCLLWLDGHHSGGMTAKGSQDTPILNEISAIFNDLNHDHVVLIDDARCFDGSNGYPTTEELKDLFKSHRSNWDFEIKHDIIRIIPRESA